MGDSLRRKATYADLEQLPEHVVGELLEGELYVSPQPASPHVLVTMWLTWQLNAAFNWERGRLGGWVLLPEPELHLGEHVLVPDLAGWRRERMPHIPEVVGFPLAPDWVCEVLSPSIANLDREKKMPLYARQGIQHLWLVEPVARTLEVYLREGSLWLLQGSPAAEELVRAEPFHAQELELGLLWSR